MARIGRYVATIWDTNEIDGSGLFQKLSEIGLTLHDVEGIDSVPEIKFNNTILFFYIVNKFNGQFDCVASLKRRYSARKFICIDMLGFESLKQICELGDVIYIQRKLTLSELENFIVSQCIDVLESAADSDHAEQSDIYHIRRLAQRLDVAASAISGLRINSISFIAVELQDISSSLKALSPQSYQDLKRRREISIKGETKTALAEVGKIFDALDNSKIAAIVVSGAVTAIIGCGGWSAVACQTVCLAAWHGKDALIAAINKLPGPRVKIKKDDKE